MDLISRQAAIDKINERQRKLIYCFGFENDMVKIMDIAKSIVNAIPSAQPDRCENCVNFSKTRLLIPLPYGFEKYRISVVTDCGYVEQERRWRVMINTAEFNTLLRAALDKAREQAKADGCWECAFVEKNEWEMPCGRCKRNCKDYWRPMREEGGK